MQVYEDLETQVFTEIKAQAPDLSRQSFNCERSFSRTAFDAVNGMLTQVYTARNRVRSDHGVLWRPALRPQRLPAAAELKEDILKQVSDSCRYKFGVMTGIRYQPNGWAAVTEIAAREDDSEKEVDWYLFNVNENRREDLSSTQQAVAAYHTAHKVGDESQLLVAVSDMIVHSLLHDVTEIFHRMSMGDENPDGDKAQSTAATLPCQGRQDTAPTLPCQKQHDTASTLLCQEQHDTSSTLPCQEQQDTAAPLPCQEQQDAAQTSESAVPPQYQSSTAEETAVNHGPGNASVIAGETSIDPGAEDARDGRTDCVVDLIGIQAQSLQMNEDRGPSSEGVHAEVCLQSVQGTCSLPTPTLRCMTELLGCILF